MAERIAIVGTGPTGIYTLQNLLQGEPQRSIFLYERGRKAGVGMPYSAEIGTAIGKGISAGRPRRRWA